MDDLETKDIDMKYGLGSNTRHASVRTAVVWIPI